MIDNLLEKESINKNDIKDLKTAIQTLNYEKYHNDIEMIQPVQEYKEIALNAPKILIDYIDTYILKEQKMIALPAKPTQTHKLKSRRR